MDNGVLYYRNKSKGKESKTGKFEHRISIRTNFFLYSWNIKIIRNVNFTASLDFKWTYG